MAGILPQIEHVVVLMLENRSLDNLLGWLYADRENRPTHDVPKTQGRTPYYDGLVEGKFSNPDEHGVEHPVVEGTGSCEVPKADPQDIPQVDGTWGLGSRTDNAPTFEAVLNAIEPRTDLPSLGAGSCSGDPAANKTSAITAEVAGAEPLTDIHQSLFPLVVQNATEGRLAPENPQNQKIVEEMLELQTQRDLWEFFRSTRWESYD
jgi:hypothetical protein